MNWRTVANYLYTHDKLQCTLMNNSNQHQLSAPMQTLHKQSMQWALGTTTTTATAAAAPTKVPAALARPGLPACGAATRPY